MLRLAALTGLFSFLLVGCTCTPPPVSEPDSGGPPPTLCDDDLDCPIGQACVEGQCGLPPAGDASIGCDRNEDCPEGQVCLPSSRTCVTPVEEDGGTDGGQQTGDCFEGQTQSCGSSKLGECRLGVSTCTLAEGVWSFGPCVGAVDPSAEVCDGKDNDCDGVVDDGLGTQSCGVGACARTVDACVGGQPGTCVPGPSSAEVCDGLDNDCDGTPDDNIPNLTCGVGACARSVPACSKGTPQSCTPGSPTNEVCNGLDDDCDGVPDDGLGQETCGQGICVNTVDRCVNGVPQTCNPLQGRTETCDGLDDDCDGVVDEGCQCTNGQSEACYTGPAGTKDVGECRGGARTCSGGQWGTCTGQTLPVAETCNGKDDNCSGQTDEGLGSSTCGNGACRRTVQNCLNGAPQACTPGSPGTETCNGVDDDCDGATDEDLGTTSCGVGACRVTVQACVNGSPAVCNPGSPGSEVCNGADDDCDGDTDESFPQQGQSCITGLRGLCATGAYACTSGAVSCAQTVFPTTEVCHNGLDEDCNGIVDDPIGCGCNSQVDNDYDGANECQDCNDNDGTVFPGQTERCNGKDDDCDGSLDEGFDIDTDGFTTCGTVSTGGVDPQRVDCNDNNPFVFPLKTADCGNAATPASPNGVDDNCNGYVDETCNCSNVDRDGDGVTPCQGDCNDNDPTIAPNKPEVCDGKDNDCDKATVDNCGVSDRCGFKQGNAWYRWPAGTDECKANLVCVSNVSTGELTCGSFCNQSQGAGLNDSCAVGEGCQRNLVDSDNLHLCSVVPTGSRSTGQSCTVSSECRTGDCLTTDGTTDYCTDKCTHQAGCSSNTTCYVERGALGFPQPQGYYYYSYCRLTSNISGTKTVGQTCTGSECRTGQYACLNGRCVAPCCQHSDCGSGYVCSINGPTVSTGYSSGGIPIWSVLPACLQSTANKVSGQACGGSSECKSGICDKAQNICVDVCCNTSSCPNGTTCEPLMYKSSAGRQTYIRACVFSPVPALVEQK